VQGTLGRLTQILRASSILTTGSDEYVDRMGYINLAAKSEFRCLLLLV
jgi:hypothetical protein